MNYLILLSGGIGSRMKSLGRPKQYFLVNDKPIFLYALETFDLHSDIDGIIIVAHEEWRKEIKMWIKKSNIRKFLGFAIPGESRQESIYNGLKYLQNWADSDANVIIHDAARPLVSSALIQDCLIPLDSYEGVIPVLPIKDTVYQSKDGKHIDNLLPRAQLFAGQAPESFKFQKYLSIHENMKKSDLKMITGSTEIALNNHMDILMIPGEECNFKITTDGDLDILATHLKEK